MDGLLFVAIEGYRVGICKFTHNPINREVGWTWREYHEFILIKFVLICLLYHKHLLWRRRKKHERILNPPYLQITDMMLHPGNRQTFSYPVLANSAPQGSSFDPAGRFTSK